MALELISFGTGAKWISQLWSRLKGGRKALAKELDDINLIIFGDPVETARYYVEPDCQDRNPADRPEEDRFLSKTPVMKTIDDFFVSERIFTHGGNQMFVLSDAGMGKTALLTMLKLMHLTAFWPRQKDCVLKKLGEKTIDELAEIPNKRETILLLDSLDEDPMAFGRAKERLLDILHASQDFFRVVITCRTQFFPDMDKDPLDRLGMYSIGGYTCPVKYLSFFSDDKVTAYLDKRFPKKFGLLPDTENLRKAGQVIEKMGSLRCRPMLLAYIEDLMASPLLHHEDSEYQIYDALVKSWLNREQLKDKTISVNDLQDASIILATWLQVRKRRSINEAELDELIARIAKVRTIQRIEIKGRSLLNRNSEGNYRFSHSSVQEFLVAKLLLENPVYKPKERIPITDFIFRMIASAKKPLNYPELLDCRGLNLSGLRFCGIDLSGADLSEADLSECVFESARFEGTDFSNASLKGVCFEAGSLRKATFQGADLADTKIVNSELGMTFLYILPGRFLIGDDHDGPVHEVNLTTGFYMQTTPVTQGQWQAVMGNNPAHFDKCGPDCPVESVSWNDAQAFIRKLNEMEGGAVYRLPTEAQWEYACRAGTMSRYCFGDDESRLAEYAWYDKNSGETTHPVAILKPNDWGLYDMHGNVWEWCQDWHGEYPNHSVSDPTGPENGAARVIRGGAWLYSAECCRTAYRYGDDPVNRYDDLGFRLVRLPGQPGEPGQSSPGATRPGINPRPTCETALKGAVAAGFSRVPPVAGGFIPRRRGPGISIHQM